MVCCDGQLRMRAALGKNQLATLDRHSTFSAINHHDRRHAISQGEITGIDNMAVVGVHYPVNPVGSRRNIVDGESAGTRTARNATENQGFVRCQQTFYHDDIEGRRMRPG